MKKRKLFFTFIRLHLNNSIRKRHSLNRCRTSWYFNWTNFLQKILYLHILNILLILSKLFILQIRNLINRHIFLIKPGNNLFRWPLRIICGLRFLVLILLIQLINTFTLFNLLLIFFKPLNIWTRSIWPYYLMSK